ncbi:MAG: DUF4340 domain-containing protein [Myxococcales bacterium]|nr:DUF4340 domain-containing protein [Myxococcales bacterium]
MNARAAATPVVLLVLAAGAAAYAYLVDPSSVSDADRSERRRDVFPSLRVDDVSRVEIVHGDDTLVLERDPRPTAGSAGAWTMTSPVHEPADASAVDVLLRELELAPRLRDAPRDAPGLEPVRARGKLTVGPIQYRFTLGGDAPTPEGAAYLEVDDEGTFVVSQTLKVQLLRRADAYRDRTMVPLRPNELAGIEVRKVGGGSFALERRGTADDTFRVVPAGLRAARTTVERLFSALADARAETFLSDAEATASLPTERIVLTPRDPAAPRVELDAGGPCPGDAAGVVLLRTAPTRRAACVAKTLVEALDGAAASLVDTAPFFARADEMEQIRLDALGGGPRVELARKGTGWHERAPADRDLSADESESASELARALEAARAEGAPKREGPDSFAPRARATVVRGGKIEETVEVGAPSPEGITKARRLDDGAVLRLDRAAARRLEPHPVALRPAALWRTAFGTGEVVAVDDGCTRAPEKVDRVEGTWTARSPAGTHVDASGMADRIDALARARAEAWIAETDDSSFGFERKGSCSVTVTLAAGPGESKGRKIGIAFGAEGEGGVYARTGDDPAVFVADPLLRTLFARPAVDADRGHEGGAPESACLGPTREGCRSAP